MTILVRCDNCLLQRVTTLTPTGVVVLPEGWEQGVPILKDMPSPRKVVHGCGKLECKLVGHAPPSEPKEGSWGASGTP